MQNFEDSFDGTFTQNLKQTSKNHNSNKTNKIIVNVADTQYAVVKHIGKKYKWGLSIDPLLSLNFDICWIDNHLKPQLFARMGQHQKVNHIPAMEVLARKNSLGKNLMLFRRKYQLDYDFFPITWSLPNDYPQLLDYHQNRQQGKAQTFIVKPQASCQGRGIFLTRNIEKLKNEKYVVQRYMHKPYLIDGLKFDLRIYVLITGVDPLRIFVFEQGLARFATQQYRPPRSQNLQNKFMHLTNYAINKQNPNFIFNQSVSDMSIGHKRSLTSVYERIKQDGNDVQAVKQRINDIFIKTIITGYPALSRAVLSIHPDNFANDMCFQILGFDVMLDHKLNPTLIEINHTPSFTADTPLDRFIKKKLIQDTFSLLGITQKWKAQQRRKRDKQFQQRMVTGKRKKYSIQQRKYFMQEFFKKRNQHQQKILNQISSQSRKKNGFTKIFILSKDQYDYYKPFYEFAQQIYKNYGTGLSNSYMSSTGYINGMNKSQNMFQYYFQNINQSNQDKKQMKSMKNSYINPHANKSIIMSSGNTKKNNKSSDNQSTIFASNNNTSNVYEQENMNFYPNKRATSAKSKIQSINAPKSRKQKRGKQMSSSKCLRKRQFDASSQVSSNSKFFPGQYENLIQNQSIFTNKGLQNALLLKRKRSQNLNLDNADHHQNLQQEYPLQSTNKIDQFQI